MLCNPFGVSRNYSNIHRGYRFTQPPANSYDPFGITIG